MKRKKRMQILGKSLSSLGIYALTVFLTAGSFSVQAGENDVIQESRTGRDTVFVVADRPMEDKEKSVEETEDKEKEAEEKEKEEKEKKKKKRKKKNKKKSKKKKKKNKRRNKKNKKKSGKKNRKKKVKDRQQSEEGADIKEGERLPETDEYKPEDGKEKSRKEKSVKDKTAKEKAAKEKAAKEKAAKEKASKEKASKEKAAKEKAAKEKASKEKASKEKASKEKAAKEKAAKEKAAKEKAEKEKLEAERRLREEEEEELLLKKVEKDYTVFTDSTDSEGRLVFKGGKEVLLPETAIIGLKKTGENSGSEVPIKWAQSSELNAVKAGKTGEYKLYFHTGAEFQIGDKTHRNIKAEIIVIVN